MPRSITDGGPGTTFRGRLLAYLTILERSQPRGTIIVTDIEFSDDEAVFTLLSGDRISLGARTRSSDFENAFRSRLPALVPADESDWEVFPEVTDVAAGWLALHYDLATHEGHLLEAPAAPKLQAVRLEGEFATVLASDGTATAMERVPLDTLPLAVAIDLAHQFLHG